MLYTISVFSAHSVVSFQVHQPRTSFRSTTKVPFFSYKVYTCRRVASSIRSKADPADNEGQKDPIVSVSHHPYDFDLAIIGAGPVGVQAAITAAGKAKKKVVLIDAPGASGQLINKETNEDLSIGGPTGLFSKALRDAAKRIKVPNLRGMGLREDSIWNEISSMCVELASYNALDTKRQLEYFGVTLIEGYAKFDDSGDIHLLVISHKDGTTTTATSTTKTISTTTISADKILIATGSKPFRPSNIPFDGVRVFDSDSINGLNFLPKSVVITGR